MAPANLVDKETIEHKSDCGNHRAKFIQAQALYKKVHKQTCQEDVKDQAKIHSDMGWQDQKYEIDRVEDVASQTGKVWKP